MGWCSATIIFDKVVGSLLGESKRPIEDVIANLIDILEENDWDCQMDSMYFGNPIVEKIMKTKHPSWFEEESK